MENEPDKVQILDQLERIVASPGFVSSPRKRKFLRYIVEKTIEGEGETLKGYAIGVDVFERGEQFDPQEDTIVRVQARNLRRALELYNLSDGLDDPVKIELVKGSYVPQFSLKEVVGSAELSPANPSNEWQKQAVNKKQRKWAVPGLAAVGLALLLAWGMFNLQRSNDQRASFKDAVKMPMGPSIAVLPFDIIHNSNAIADTQNLENLRFGLHYELVDKISRFKDLFVVQLRSDPRVTLNNQNLQTPTQFLLSGSIQQTGDHIRVTSILSQTVSGEVLWTRSHGETLDSPSSILMIQSDIAVDVAASLGQPYSRINTRFASEQARAEGMDFNHYLCLMRFYTYLKAKTETEHAQVRDCLEAATQSVPGFSSGWAALSWMYADEAFNRFNVRAGDAPPRERAVKAAQEAVKSDPDNAMAYQYLAIAKFTAGDDRGFFKAAETALALNPNDAEILADVGSHLIQLENSDRGRAMVEKAIAMNPAHPAWYHGSIYMYHYIRNETGPALFHAQEYLKDGSIAARMAYTAILVQDGQLDAAKAAYQSLIDFYPEFPRDYQTIIDQLRMPSGMEPQFIEDLKIAGLTPAI